MSDPVLGAAADLLVRRVGLRVDPNMRARLLRCLRELAAASGQQMDELVVALGHDPARLQELLDLLTVQKSEFFRDPLQFEAFARHVLPVLREPVTVWSAGCAAGQEAYSLAMLLQESGRSDWSVVGTDISARAVRQAADGRYPESALNGLSPVRRARHLRPVAGGFQVVPELRRRVTVARHNLAENPPPLPAGTCSVVFCRNVLIYFRREDVVDFLRRLAAWLPPDGWLFLGYAESLWHITELFRLEPIGRAYAYRPAGAPSAVPPAAATASRRPRAGPGGPQPARRAGRPIPPVADLLAAGEAAFARGDHTAAAAAFRKAVYVDADQPVAHLHLGVALEALGEAAGAARAYAAARAALQRCDTAAVETALEGFSAGELAALLDAKLQGSAR